VPHVCHHLWAFAATALLSGLVGSRIPRPRARVPEAVSELPDQQEPAAADTRLALPG